MKTVLITGGAGFIGSHVAKVLLERGDNVVLLDDFNDFLYDPSLKEDRLKSMFVETPKVERVDILDEAELNRVFGNKFDVVVHLAAYANPRLSLQAEEIYTEVNVRGTLNVLKACTKHGVGKVVFAGSSSVYNDEKTPFKENSYPLKPRSPYGASKAAAEVYCAMWHELHALPVTVLRFFSVYGPWGRPDMAPYIFADRILNGQVVELNRVQRQRDFTYIDDIVSGVVAAVDTELGFEVINIGRGQPVGLSDLIIAIESAAGRQAKIVERDTPPGEMKVTYADTSKAKELFGYEPKVSIAEGTKKLVEWMKEYSINKIR